MNKKIINLDNAAATKLLPESLEVMLPYLTGEKYLNPSAPYLQALEVRRDYDEAKNRLAHTIGAVGDNLIITGNATEANNLAVTAIRSFPDAEILLSPFEHPSVKNIPLKNKKIIKTDNGGIINLHELKKQITSQTVLISICLVAADLGTIQPLAEVSALIHWERQRRLSTGSYVPLWLHSDASQSFDTLEVNVARLGVDLLTLNSAKMHGPKGVAALFVKPASGIKLSPIIYGGGQEKGLRSGTENVAGLVGFANSADHLTHHRKKHYEDMKSFKNQLKTALAEAFDNQITFLGNTKKQSVNFLPVIFDGYDAERLIFALESHDILVSTGAACSAEKREPSGSLQAIGLSPDRITGSLRLSFSSENTPDQIPAIIAALKKALIESNRV